MASEVATLAGGIGTATASAPPIVAVIPPKVTRLRKSFSSRTKAAEAAA